MGLADQPALRVVEIHDAGRAGLDAHLVLDGAAGGTIAGTQRTVFLDQEFRHDEQADALDALGTVGDPGQHQMDDVLGQVMLARRDEDLGAGDLVGAVFLGNRLGAHQAEIGAAMGFGQVHRAGPGSVHHLGQIDVLQFLGAVGMDRLVGAVGQARIHAERQVGRAHHFLDEHVDRGRHALAAEGRVAADAGPAALLEGVVGFLEPLRRADDAILEMAAFEIAGSVERLQNLGGKLGGFLQHGIDQVGSHVLEAGERGDFLALMQLEEDEAHVAQGCGIGRHGMSP